MGEALQVRESVTEQVDEAGLVTIPDGVTEAGEPIYGGQLLAEAGLVTAMARALMSQPGVEVPAAVSQASEFATNVSYSFQARID
jgi:hypothetical protein